jgi:hypothetical protein
MLQYRGHSGGVPVMNMHDVRKKSEPGGDEGDRLREEGEALGIVGQTVELVVPKARVTDEGEANVTPFQRTDPDPLRPTGKGNLDIADPKRGRVGLQSRVPWVDDQHLIAPSGLRRR